MRARRYLNRLLYIIMVPVAIGAIAYNVLFVFVLAMGDGLDETTVADGSDPAIAMLKEWGWVPEWMPTTVTNFHEAHKVSDSYGMMRFDFAGSVEDMASTACVRSDKRAEAAEFVPRFRSIREWWPAKVISAELTSGAWPLYECSGLRLNFWLAVSPGQRYYMWQKGN